MSRGFREISRRALCLRAAFGLLAVAAPGCGGASNQEQGASGIPASVEESNKTMEDFMKSKIGEEGRRGNHAAHPDVPVPGLAGRMVPARADLVHHPDPSALPFQARFHANCIEARLHADRVAGGDRHHRGPDRPAAARRPGGARGGPAVASASTTSSRSAWPCTTTTRRRTPSRWGRPWPRTIRPTTTFWNDWSAHAQLLQYLEGSPIFNACNFSLAPEWANNYGYLANSTATNTKINPFTLPLGPERGPAGVDRRQPRVQQQLYGEHGHVDDRLPRGDAEPRERAAEFGALRVPEVLHHRERHRRDIQHGRLLRGDRGRSGPQLLEEAGQGDRGRQQPPGHFSHRCQHRGTRPRPGRHPGVQRQVPGRRGGKQGGGYRWSCGAMGYTMFNTVIPPNGGGRSSGGPAGTTAAPNPATPTTSTPRASIPAGSTSVSATAA